MNCYIDLWTWTYSYYLKKKCPDLRNMDLGFGTWNVISLYRASSLMAVSKELFKYKLHLVGANQARWDSGGTDPAGEYTFFYGKGNDNHELGIGSLCIRESCQQ
jgi:hypothetical protein